MLHSYIRVLRIPTLAAALAISLAVVPGVAKAGPDIDGAVDALISWPFNVFGDLAGAAGLMTAAVGGGAGDIVAIVDEHEVGRLLLRGVVSTTAYRLSLTTSRFATGAMEGARGENIVGITEPIGRYNHDQKMDVRVDTFKKGFGSAGLAVVDFIAGPFLVLSRCFGAAEQASQLDKWQTDSRNDWVGKAR